jgi:hypothetical protein
VHRALLLVLAAFAATPALAQDDPQALLMRQASGTMENPAAAGMPMIMLHRGRWMFMSHGQLFVDHANDSGLRGGAKTFSTNWLMASASRPVGGGALMIRSMLSLEPATISGRKYPELFQTGETAFGKQLIDGQHPHDFFMELAAEYAHPIGRAVGYLYVAPVGDPALGPVAFPHRDSAADIPQAPLGHHFLDSTHIAYDVVTAGASAGKVTLEASAFHGQEPDEKRWDIEHGKLDSWSARIQLRPTEGLALQVSTGRLAKPERIEPGFARRTTASASYVLAASAFRWSSTAAWGQVYKEVHDRTLTAWLGEASIEILGRHHLTARYESDQKDELFPHALLARVPRPPLPVRVFRVQATTVGYSIDLLRGSWGTAGAGANATAYHFPPILEAFYGAHPHAVVVFVRGRLGGRM